MQTFDEWWSTYEGPRDQQSTLRDVWKAGRDSYKKALYQQMYSAGHMDPGVEMVREFHEAFGAHIASEPGFPELDDDDRSLLAAIGLSLGSLAKALKNQAAEANAAGRPGLGLLLIRLQLHIEENGELADAFGAGDLVEALDALTDISYVVDGTYLTLGLGEAKVEADQEVHRSNMTKLGPDGKPIISDAGRVVKGPNYSRPDLATVIGRAANRALFP